MTVAKTFKSEKEMLEWLSTENNIEDLKAEYPNTTAVLNLIDKQIEITKN
jgi:hypothetical protein